MNLWGATLVAPDRTRFRLWAPDSDAVSLLLEGHAPLPMRAEADGWFTLEAGCGTGTRYRFQVAPGLVVPDPASRAQQGGVHGSSVVTDLAAYPWRHADWRGRPWHEAVIYEAHTGCLGGFDGVRSQLPRLRDLGVTALELMPIGAFPGERGWGYDGVLPFAPQESYGTPEDLMRLVDEAHGLGLMVLLDVVYNHFGPDGAYMHAYARRFFDAGQHTPWGAAIDFRQPTVRAFFEENALHWLRDHRFDGLRLDAVHAISPPEWLDALAARIRAEIPGRHVHLVLENEHNDVARLAHCDAQWNDDGHNILHPLLTGEREAYYAPFAEDGATKLATVLREGFLRQPQPSAHLPPTSFVLFLQNHDQVGNRAFGERLCALADPEALSAASALLLLSPQIPLLFMGEEWAASAPFLFFTDHNAELAPLVTAGRRKEFARFAAFADAATRERIPDPNAEATFLASIPNLAEAQHEPHAGVLALHHHLLTLRHAHIIPRLAGARALDAEPIGDKAVLARWRMGDGATLSIASNLGDAALPCALPAAPFFASTPAPAGTLPPRCTIASLT